MPVENDSINFNKALNAFDLSPERDFSSNEGFREILIKEVDRLLTMNPEKLMQIFYRLDVDEAKVQTVFNVLGKEQWASALADIIIEREKWRIELKKKYGSGESM